MFIRIREMFYVNKLNNCQIKEPKQETLDYYGVKFDEVKREYV